MNVVWAGTNVSSSNWSTKDRTVRPAGIRMRIIRDHGGAATSLTQGITSADAKARRAHLVLDNLNTHFRKCFDNVLGQRAATKLLRRHPLLRRLVHCFFGHA
jgi:hypothetical protein